MLVIVLLLFVHVEVPYPLWTFKINRKNCLIRLHNLKFHFRSLSIIIQQQLKGNFLLLKG